MLRKWLQIHPLRARNHTIMLKVLHAHFFQMGKCSHTSDNVTNGHSYRHICSHCFAVGKHFPHPQKDCRNAKKVKVQKNE